MTTSLIRKLVLAALAAGISIALAQPAPERGQLLYSNHCIECHNTQIHWRELKQVRDWDSLRAQVQRWQQIARLGWDEVDVDEVARYLNRTIYRFAQPGDKVGQILR